MSLIFDSFPSVEMANSFANHVRQQFKRTAKVFLDEESALQSDPVPVELIGPIVHVSRDIWCSKTGRRVSDPLQESIVASVKEFGGVFVGT